MTKFSEVGHAKNVANFSSLIQILEEMDTLYSPTNPNLKLSELKNLQTALAQSIIDYNEKNPFTRMQSPPVKLQSNH